LLGKNAPISGIIRLLTGFGRLGATIFCKFEWRERRAGHQKLMRQGVEFSGAHAGRSQLVRPISDVGYCLASLRNGL